MKLPKLAINAGVIIGLAFCMAIEFNLVHLLMMKKNWVFQREIIQNNTDSYLLNNVFIKIVVNPLKPELSLRAASNK